MIDFAADLAAILGMGDLAQDAVLIPRTGSASALRVIPRGGDLIPDFGQAQVVLGAAMFTTAAAALPRPQAGDRLTVGASQYELLSDAKGDARGLTWLMECRTLSGP